MFRMYFFYGDTVFSRRSRGSLVNPVWRRSRHAGLDDANLHAVLERATA